MTIFLQLVAHIGRLIPSIGHFIIDNPYYTLKLKEAVKKLYILGLIPKQVTLPP